MTGDSTSTPTTVARAAPEPGPWSAIVVATASSKKLLEDELARVYDRPFGVDVEVI